MATAATNAFAALRKHQKAEKRKERGAPLDIPDEQPSRHAAPPAKEIVSIRGMNWADISEDDDFDDEEPGGQYPTDAWSRISPPGQVGNALNNCYVPAGLYGQQPVGGTKPPSKTPSKESDYSDEGSSDSFVSESEVDDDAEDDSKSAPDTPPDVPKLFGTATVKLSKKELQQKELDELGAAFAELGIAGPNVPSESQHTTGQEGAGAPSKRALRKKAKKSRGAVDACQTGEEGNARPQSSDGQGAAVENAAATSEQEGKKDSPEAVNKEEALEKLKSRQNKKKGPTTTTPVKVTAVEASLKAEAKKRAEAKKQKPKKSDRAQPYQR